MSTHHSTPAGRLAVRLADSERLHRTAEASRTAEAIRKLRRAELLEALNVVTFYGLETAANEINRVLEAGDGS